MPHIYYTWQDKRQLTSTIFSFHENTYVDIRYIFISLSVCMLNILGLNNHHG
jgi:hypothetical protein